MMKSKGNKFYYIFKDDKYIETCNIEELAKFLKRDIEEIKKDMQENTKRKYCILKNDKGIEYRIENEKQFFGKRNVK